MKLDSAIEKRRSVREFSDKKVKFGDVLEAIDAAIQAPFAGNINNLKFIILQDQDSKNGLAECCQQDFVADAQFVIIVCAEYEKLEKMYDEHAEIYARQHAGAAIENFLLKITDLKLSSCWIGAFTDDTVKMDLGIPEEIEIEAILPIGYKQKRIESKTPTKNSLERSIYWGKWGEKKKPTGLKDPRTS